ncbi:[Fe-Fe] hydrogenase large subunit C-terminal domain-containing protein [Clostridium sp. AL.422]|uniref:[Fe-Fe] hydrogenase large subunit C-terminal domain-containing protein n=1 Tax=Clostridium TaxID=1485 RepID=UPI00293DA4B6|nr:MULTISPECIES: [Fe-Fe] hydrogenase large subunit C-terminal domain-containing protein [unclassified Clostridium]MDV4151962.1 [Fe-Fe] hydrogenase large subunit C-terminal domain-containing protein [Clostridium sp. AL.422]
MHSKYNDIFDTLVKSYYQGNFEETLTNIMVCHEISPQETFQIISSLCGVSLEFNNDYVYNLKKAITNYEVNKRLIEKLESCNLNCKKEADEKYKCQLSCPFDAIIYDENKKSTYINYNLCVGCGLCIDSCKEGKILDKIDFIPIIDLIKNNKTVIAAVAPAIIGQFGKDVSLDQLREAFIKIGFSDMIEVAFAADMLTIKEAVEFDKHVNGPNDLMITSCCCPMWVGMLKKVYKELVPDLSPSVSPMIGAGRIIKRLDPDAKVVFIGPCIAKKAEAKEKDLVNDIDFVLTFQELDNIFKVLEINPSELNGLPTKDYASRGGRLYARTGGVSIAVGEAVEELYPAKAKLFKPAKAEGVRECKDILNKALSGEIKANFIEGMGCVGGCVGGPKALISKEEGKIFVDNLAYNSPIKIATHSSTMDKVLEELNITSLIDFKDNNKTKIFHRNFN